MLKAILETMQGKHKGEISDQELCGREVLNAASRSEFEKNISLDKKDFGAIEYLLRKGQRQLDIYSAPGIKNIKP